MAPSATSWTAADEGTNGAVAGAANGTTNGYAAARTNGHLNNLANSTGHMGGDPNLYTTGYTHGFTNGYITGYASSEMPKQMPIAIVGMSCRLPGNVATPDEFWELCSRARNGWSEIPKERFENASFHHPNPGKSGCFNAVGGNFLKEDLGLFDAPFFSLTAQEATSMDPQQRLLLECTFEALDSAGIPKHEIVGKEVGVFIGGSFSEYESQLFQDTETIPMYQATGCAFAMQSNRLSHFFDLRGPSFTMDTACSSSLVALHLACQSLRNGESKSAIVGGCHLNMLPEFWVSMSMSRLFSDEGRSFSFDNRGTGYGRGEGCGMVVLKPLEQALRDNDTIRAVIVGSGINQDGKTPGITMPNGAAQEALMQQVYRSAGINPKDTGYVEAHGTGTKVGDPIEATALHNVFGEERSARNPLYIGSVKSNIGHLEAASGIISIIKTAMMLERGFILPNYDFKKPNDKIPFSKWHLKVPISQRPWPRPKRFASVNNFGFGGTNAHVVLERAPFLKKHENLGTESPESSAPARKLFILSANDKTALDTMMKNLGIYLEQRPEIFQNDLMSNVAYTLGQRRSLMQWRIAISSASSFDLIQTLNAGKLSPTRETDPPRIGFIFTGQGAQWNAMGRELYEQYPVFAATIDACDKCLASFGASFSLVAELSKDAKTTCVNEAHISQPACTAIQLALTDLLRAWGVWPTAVTGHSSGEIAAAYAAGVLPLDSCMAISYFRGVVTVGLKKKFPDLKGSMMAVGGSKEEIAPLIAELKKRDVRIACFNSPTSLTISGDEPAIDELQAKLEEKAVFNRKLQVDVAYHSHHMKLVAKDYQESLQWLDQPKSTEVRFYSSLLGHLIDGSQLQPSYWVGNLTQAVRFSEALTAMTEPAKGHKTGVNMLIEIGPHSALAGPIKQILKAAGANAAKIPYASALVRKRDAVETALELAATLFVKGATLNMGAINFPKPSKPPLLLVDMPRYPWNHATKYWHESRMMLKHKNRTTPRNDILGTLANYSNDLEPTWRNIIRVDDLPWLRHHKIQSLVLFPMSAFVSMAVEAASQRATWKGVQFDKFELRDVSVHSPLMIADDDIEVTLQLRPYQEGTLVSSETWDEFRIHSWAANKGWTEHCKGLICVKGNDSDEVDGARLAQDSEAMLKSAISKISGSDTVAVDRTKLYDSLSELGVSYGPTFQGMVNCQASDKGSVADLTVADTTQEMPQGYQTSTVIHPAFLEQLIEMYWPVLGAGRASIETVYLPSSIMRMTLARNVNELTNKPGDTLRAFCKGVAPSGHPKPMQVSMFAMVNEDSKEAVIMMDDLTISPIVERGESSDSDAHRELCYKLDWEPILESTSSQVTPSATNGVTNGISNGVHNSINGTPNNVHNVADFPQSQVVIIHGESDAQKFLAVRLADTLSQATGKRPEVGTLSEVNTAEKLCLFLSELDKPLLTTLTVSQFTALQKVLTSVQGVLWVVRGAYADSVNPDANMVTGLSRTIRSETLLKFGTLDLDAKPKLSEEGTAKAIVGIYKAVFGPKAEANCELEFMERNGSFFTPRIINDPEMNEYVHKQTQASVLENTPFAQEDRPLKMAVGTPGALDTLHFVDDEFVEVALADDEIEIQVKAIGMNQKELTAIMGQLDNFNFGVECSGIVTRTGSRVSNFSIGDRVAGLSISQGVYATFARTKAAFAFKLSPKISFEAAAATPVAYCTAYYGLIDLARLAEDESVFIHGAATAAGQAAVSIAQMIGAEVFATVSGIEGKQLLKSVHGLSDDHIFSSRNASFGPAIRKAINRQGVDVVLNAAAADSDTLRETWDCLSNFGRFVEVGKRDVSARLETARFENNTSFMSVDLMSLAAERPKIMSRLISDFSNLLRNGNIKPDSPVTVFPISDVETAFKVLQSGNFDGKLVVMPQPGDEVKATRSSKQNKLLRQDATYILIGGTGGLGRSMARWMVGKGAVNIVLISRSGSAIGKVKELIDEMAGFGANILVRRCDVANPGSVDNLIHNELVGLPPVRGVVHGAMVLRDVLFEKMTFDEYSTVIESKVQGAWNFHNTLKAQSLDFFVAISSAAAAVGNRGQAAYAAANAFLNAFVQFRLAQGLPASSIDLTAVSDSGYLAENAEAAAEVMRNLGSDTICEAEVLALLGAAISGRLASACNNHTITGMRITPTPPFWTQDAKFKHLRLAAEALAAENSAGQDVAISYNAALKAAKSLEEAQEVVCAGLLNKLPSVLMLEKEDMDVTRSLSNYALDSLVAIEVRNYITREFEANLQVLELLSSGSIETLAKAICVKSKLVSF
ncbi:BcPKS8, polyketide synthase [Hyaloscypha variabilis F]|uniref:BcPKS8, polyketide synthase n=1 Tax=Hyaloscypha variabilis (strain UAMH 11265 / GT02V1 / F) TaxID=1149755 RepID=A0A2J6RDZ6_HYAVF|nr:BcPKS8, polyketide synthase [Hyaloscypha variabilis F]